MDVASTELAGDGRLLEEVVVRRVEDLMEALWGTRVSPSTASERKMNISEPV